MQIMRVTPEDTAELLEIYSYYVEKTAITFEYENPSEEEFRGRIENISSKYPYIKAVEDGKILGYAYASTFKGRAAYDWSVEATVYVREDARRGGIGKALYEALEKSLANMGILNMNACIALPEENDEYLTRDSYEFHLNRGFKLVGTFHNSGYKFNKWYDMIWMEKMLGVHTETPSDVQFGQWEV